MSRNANETIGVMRDGKIVLAESVDWPDQTPVLLIRVAVPPRTPEERELWVRASKAVPVPVLTDEERAELEAMFRGGQSVVEPDARPDAPIPAEAGAPA